MRPTEASAPADTFESARTLIRLVRLLNHRLRQRTAADPLTVLDLSVMGAISRGWDLPSVLARRLQVDPGRVTRIADRQFELGYIERESDPVDRRLCHLRLTVSGEQRLATGRQDLGDIMADLEQRLAPAERQGLQVGLDGMRRILDEQRAEET